MTRYRNYLKEDKEFVNIGTDLDTPGIAAFSAILCIQPLHFWRLVFKAPRFFGTGRMKGRDYLVPYVRQLKRRVIVLKCLLFPSGWEHRRDVPSEQRRAEKLLQVLLLAPPKQGWANISYCNSFQIHFYISSRVPFAAFRSQLGRLIPTILSGIYTHFILHASRQKWHRQCMNHGN